jgi:hypothetical protein
MRWVTSLRLPSITARDQSSTPAARTVINLFQDPFC